MEYIHAALLLHSAGKPVDEAHLKKVVEATGEKADEARIKALVAALQGIDIKAAIEKAAMPVAVAAPSAQAPAGGAQQETKKKEEDTGKKEEEAAEGLAGLFG